MGKFDHFDKEQLLDWFQQRDGGMGQGNTSESLQDMSVHSLRKLAEVEDRIEGVMSGRISLDDPCPF